MVDFERAEILNRQPLGLIDANGPGTRKRGTPNKIGNDDFRRELVSAMDKVQDVTVSFLHCSR